MLLLLVLSPARARRVHGGIAPATSTRSASGTVAGGTLELFEKEVLTPVPGVHVAIGYALSNVIALEGPSGLVIVDTTESRTAARRPSPRSGSGRTSPSPRWS